MHMGLRLLGNISHQSKPNTYPIFVQNNKVLLYFSKIIPGIEYRLEVYLFEG